MVSGRFQVFPGGILIIFGELEEFLTSFGYFRRDYKVFGGILMVSR